MRLPRVVLTSEEKTALIFILIALALGLTTKHYRDQHRQAVHSPTVGAAQKAQPTPADPDE